MPTTFDLTLNPFALLGVSPRASAAALADAKADRLFDSEHDEAMLEAAHSELIVERKRLIHELSWLSDTAPNRARELVSKLPTLDPAGASELLRDGGQLSRLNLTADLLARFPQERPFAQALLAAYEDVDWASVRQAIDETRALSGFGPTRDAAWKSAQSDLIDRHATVLVQTITGTDDGPELLASMLSERGASANDRSHGLLEKAVSQYDRWSIPRLELVSEQIDSSLAKLKSIADPNQELTRLETLLSDWDKLSQPVQLRDQAKGLDEPRSLRLFKRVREVAIWFANERGNPEAAHRISQAFARTFSELPTVAAMTTADLETLAENIEAANVGRILDPLLKSADAATENLSVTARQILAGDFRAGRSGLVGTLFAAFDQARSHASLLPDPSLPWLLIRSVALALNNEFDNGAAAKALVEAVIGTAPNGARERLEEDLNALRSVELQASFGKALESGDLRRARDLVASLIDASPEERSKLVAVRDNLDSRLRTRTWKRVGWGIAAAVAAFAMLSENGTGPTPTYTTPDYSYEPTSDSMSGLDPATLTDTSLPDQIGSIPSSDTTEEPPPPYNYAALTLPQLRFCRFENARLEQLQARVESSAATKFNEMVDNYNSRCGNYRYNPSDMITVDAEIAANQSRIRSESTKLLADWSGTDRPVLSAEPPVTSADDLWSAPSEPAQEVGVGETSAEDALTNGSDLDGE